MCFSATASFSVAALLLPAGSYSFAVAQRMDSRWMPVAVYPIAFSIQQAVEGMLWIGVDSGNQTLISVASLSFLFFSHLFWLAWVPFSVCGFETDPRHRVLLVCLCGIGTVFGLSMVLPLLFSPDWLVVTRVEHSLRYELVLAFDEVVSRPVLIGFYAFFVTSALLLSSDRRIRVFGGLIAISLLVTSFFFAYAFVSIWCFFAAVLSVYIFVVVMAEHRRLSTVI